MSRLEEGTRAASVERRASGATRRRARNVRLGAFIAVGLVVGLIVWIVLDRTGNGSPTSKRSNAVIVSPRGLLTIARAVRHPIYWVGTRAGSKYELTQTAEGRIYVRYLPTGTAAGVDKPYLTVGTYPLTNAYRATRSAASAPGATRLRIGRGSIAFYNSATPTSVYLAYRGTDYQIEVFDPSPQRARALVAAHRVVAVGGSAPSVAAQARPVAVTPAALATLANALHHPLYWAGARSGVRYELSQATGGRVFIRYLPKRVPLGSRRPFLTVGTYPLPNAYRATLKASRAAGATRLSVPIGAVAFFSSSHPESVYFAERGASIQIEVYDPNPDVARQVVESGNLQPIG